MTIIASVKRIRERRSGILKLSAKAEIMVGKSEKAYRDKEKRAWPHDQR
jgi:hypothetical protein